jgi:hypothetical protein
MLQLDFWMNESIANSYRDRRRRGVRLPLTWDLGDLRMYLLVAAVLGSGLTGLPLLFIRGGWSSGLAVVLAGLVVVSLAASVRYLRLPVDSNDSESSRPERPR